MRSWLIVLGIVWGVFIFLFTCRRSCGPLEFTPLVFVQTVFRCLCKDPLHAHVAVVGPLRRIRSALLLYGTFGSFSKPARRQFCTCIAEEPRTRTVRTTCKPHSSLQYVFGWYVPCHVHVGFVVDFHRFSDEWCLKVGFVSPQERTEQRGCLVAYKLLLSCTAALSRIPKDLERS